MDDRESAIAAAEKTCPRCGAARTPDQEYCLDCGLKLPHVTGRLAGLRRRWIRRFGWYPGDWVWLSLLTLLVAAAGAAAAILLTRDHGDKGPTFTAAAVLTSVAEPTPVPSTTAPRTVNTSTLPAAPEPTTSTPGGPKNGRYVWPPDHIGWTVVLVSYPKTTGRPAALATAQRAAHSALTQVGVLDSSRYASLQPGYFVVFTGIYASRADADAAVATARQAGFARAYTRQVAR
ncbi:MAG: hypothetical protein ACJ76I_09140 [Gaiellaceae bacterium]